MAPSAPTTQPKDGKRVPFGLTSEEKWWTDRYDLLKRNGYEVRPRFRPGWTPPWIGKKKSPLLFEESFPNPHPKIIDAVRTSDKTRVAIKVLSKGSKELDIVRYLNSEGLRSDPKNHSVHLLDVFSDERDQMEFMVMPLLNRYDTPVFDSVDEVVDFMKQTLEGLSFLHSKGIAHRDCSSLNIMMDGATLFPKGFHPALQEFEASGRRLASPRHRRDVPGIRYYFTDFGLSSWFDDNSSTRLVVGEHCQDRSLPELEFDEPYDPFPVDVYLLGNVFKQRFMPTYENLDCFAPLCDRMTQRDPRARPSPDAALQLLDEIVQRQSPRSLRRLLIYRDAGKVERFFCHATSFKREVAVSLKSYLPFYR